MIQYCSYACTTSFCCNTGENDYTAILVLAFMSLLHRLGRRQTDFLRSFWNWHITFSYSFGIGTANTFIRSLENHTRFQTKMGQVYTCLQTKTVKKKKPFWAAHTCIAYIKEYPPSPPPPPEWTRQLKFVEITYLVYKVYEIPIS